MQGIKPTSQTFGNDQQIQYQVRYWDTTFTPLAVATLPAVPGTSTGSGTAATGGSTTAVIQASATWGVNALVDHTVTMAGGTAGNRGVTRTITANTATQLTVAPVFPAAVSGGDTFVISGDGNASTVVKTAAGWTSNGFAGRTITMGAGTAANVGKTRRIVSNTATVLRVSPAWPAVVVSGDAFTINAEEGIPVGSSGLRMDVREPLPGVPWTLPASIRTSGTPWPTQAGKDTVVDGRAASVVGYWAAGAPGPHGATQYRTIAYRYQGLLRSAALRSWFSSAADPLSVQFAVGGSGYCRIQVNGVDIMGGPGELVQGRWADPGQVPNGTINEQLFLNGGLMWTRPVSMSAGDALDIYYVQDREPWGGFVVKAYNVTGLTPAITSATGHRKRTEAAAAAVVVGCGLFDRGPSVPVTLPMIENITVEIRQDQSPKLICTLPLMATDDGEPAIPGGDMVGWTWQREGTDAVGYLRAQTPDSGTVDVRRGRLIQVNAGFTDPGTGIAETWNVFTGFVDDFDELATGLVSLSAMGFEQRLAEQFVKNYPDPVSYMTFNYRRTRGIVEPVYAITAYDNWPLEYAIRDMLVRTGIEESRMALPMMVPQADGTDVPASV